MGKKVIARLSWIIFYRYRYWSFVHILVVIFRENTPNKHTSFHTLCFDFGEPLKRKESKTTTPSFLQFWLWFYSLASEKDCGEWGRLTLQIQKSSRCSDTIFTYSECCPLFIYYAEEGLIILFIMIRWSIMLNSNQPLTFCRVEHNLISFFCQRFQVLAAAIGYLVLTCRRRRRICAKQGSKCTSTTRIVYLICAFSRHYTEPRCWCTDYRTRGLFSYEM